MKSSCLVHITGFKRINHVSHIPRGYIGYHGNNPFSADRKKRECREIITGEQGDLVTAQRYDIGSLLH